MTHERASLRRARREGVLLAMISLKTVSEGLRVDGDEQLLTDGKAALEFGILKSSPLKGREEQNGQAVRVFAEVLEQVVLNGFTGGFVVLVKQVSALCEATVHDVKKGLICPF